MKPRHFLLLSLITCLCSTTLSTLAAEVSATTTPVGYTSTPLAKGSTTGVPVNVHQPVLVFGESTSTTGSSLTDTTANFSTLLQAGYAYILEIESGAQKGLTLLINADAWKNASSTTAWNATTLQLPALPSGTTLEQKVTYKLRKAPTLEDIFGTNNGKGFIVGDAVKLKADTVIIPEYGNASAPLSFVYSGSPLQWTCTTTGTQSAGRFPVFFTNLVSITKRASSTDASLVHVGEVFTSDKKILLQGTHSTVNTGFATSLPLSSISPSTGLKGASLASSADEVTVPTTGNKYFYSTVSGQTGWKPTASPSTAADNVLFPGILTISRKGSPANGYITIKAPTY